MATEGLAGATAIDTSTGDVTVIVVEPVTALNVAPMRLVPVLTAVARPLVLIVAFDVVAEDQVTCEVMSWVVLSL